MTTTTDRSERRPTVREVLDAVIATYPKCCPQCFDDSTFAPTFDGKWWQCEGCGWMWEA